jgi:hypothetical protein
MIHRLLFRNRIAIGPLALTISFVIDFNVTFVTAAAAVEIQRL